jgi:uncharacterized protein with von Willebrand factor type A (vWA) domain
MINEKAQLTGPSEEGLVANISRFSHYLRENGVSVTLSSVIDTVKGLELIDIADSDLFRKLLQLNFVYRKEDINLFEELFYRFWISEKENPLTPPCEGGGNNESDENLPSDSERERADDQNRSDDPSNVPGEWFASFDSNPLNRKRKPEDFEESRTFYESIKKWLHPLRNRLSRRSRYSVRGKEISLRRILRKNMQFGGELLFLDFKKKKIKKRRIILFCDVSGSMDIYTMMLLHFIHALKRLDRSTEIFFFSTDLSRWSNQFDGSDYTTSFSKLPEFVSDWGGGTRIGHSLRQFNDTYGKRVLTSKSIVLIFSDGWDAGEAGILEHQMAYLNNKAFKIIWLNPLMGTKDYQPICQGMSTALPYVDYFLPIGNPKDLHFLVKTLEKMIV